MGSLFLAGFKNQKLLIFILFLIGSNTPLRTVKQRFYCVPMKSLLHCVLCNDLPMRN